MTTVVLVEVRVGELGENLSKLPLGRASGALLENQLERSIAVVQSTQPPGFQPLPQCREQQK